MQCINPAPIYNKVTKQSLMVPCGCCINCRVSKREEWYRRALIMTMRHRYNYFITLTYDDEHLPVDGKLHKPDVQKFFKRLRKKYADKPRQMSYLIVGEYGETTNRPHYHLLLHSKIQLSSADIRDTWQQGHVVVGDINSRSIRYTLSYTIKEPVQKQRKQLVASGEVPPFKLTSKNYGFSIEQLLKLDGKISWKYQNQDIPIDRYTYRRLYDPKCRKLGNVGRHKILYQAKIDEVRLKAEAAIINLYGRKSYIAGTVQRDINRSIATTRASRTRLAKAKKL